MKRLSTLAGQALAALIVFAFFALPVFLVVRAALHNPGAGIVCWFLLVFGGLLGWVARVSVERSKTGRR